MGALYAGRQARSTLQRMKRGAWVALAATWLACSMPSLVKAKVTLAQSKPAYDDIKQAVLFTYGRNPAVLSEFGLTAKKQAGAKDVATKQAAIIQAKATRIARHTMGSRQKQKIKGVVAPASSDVVAAAPSVAPIATANAGSNPVASNGVSVGSTVTTLNGTGH
jgi:hypothetical protein